MTHASPTRRAAVAVLALAALFTLPALAEAQSELDTPEALAFLGAWIVEMDTDLGPFSMDMEIVDQGGKVAATIGSPEIGSQEITDISRAGESLVLTFEADAQGQFFEVMMSLEPDGDDLSVLFEVGGGEFSAEGTATPAG